MLLEAGILAWSDDLETAYGVVNWLFTKVETIETKKRCQNEFGFDCEKTEFWPHNAGEKCDLKKLQLQAEMQSK